jgi:hypothetical protein
MLDNQPNATAIEYKTIYYPIISLFLFISILYQQTIENTSV